LSPASFTFQHEFKIFVPWSQTYGWHDKVKFNETQKSYTKTGNRIFLSRWLYSLCCYVSICYDKYWKITNIII